jgi:hypothetical protein
MVFDDLSNEMKDLADLTNKFATDLSNSKDERQKTYDFWKTLRKANKDYLALDVNSEGTFGEFLLHNYGIKLYFDDDGAIKAHFDIVDEHKHLMFVLTYA